MPRFGLPFHLDQHGRRRAVGGGDVQQHVRTRIADRRLPAGDQRPVGRERLAAALDVPPEKIAAWLSGEELPPLEAFLRSLDVIADGPYSEGRRRRIRVGIIRER